MKSRQLLADKHTTTMQSVHMIMAQQQSTITLEETVICRIPCAQAAARKLFNDIQRAEKWLVVGRDRITPGRNVPMNASACSDTRTDS